MQIHIAFYTQQVTQLITPDRYAVEQAPLKIFITFTWLLKTSLMSVCLDGYILSHDIVVIFLKILYYAAPWPCEKSVKPSLSHVLMSHCKKECFFFCATDVDCCEYCNTGNSFDLATHTSPLVTCAAIDMPRIVKNLHSLPLNKQLGLVPHV